MFSLGETIEKDKSSIVRDLYQSLRGNLTSQDWHNFDEQKTMRGRIRLLLGIVKEDVRTCVERKAKLHSVVKDKVKALILKDAGNKAFGSGNNEKALQMYNECLAWLPEDGSKDVPIVYANRSAALFHLGEYSLAKLDAELAFSLGYPAELHYKLYERSGRCCLHEGNRSEAPRQFKLALKALSQTSGLNESKITQLKSTLENLLKTCSSSSSSSNGIDLSSGSNNEQGMSLPEVVGGRGKYLRAASSRLRMLQNDEEGRYIVAHEEIRPGDVILVEKAFVSTLTPEYCHRQCYQCFTPIRAPVVCSNCILVSFCSVKCRDQAWATHHQYECQILGFLVQSGISIICYMALRILTQAGLTEVLKWYDLANETEEIQTSTSDRDEEVQIQENGENVKTKQIHINGNNKNSSKKGKGKEQCQANEEYRTDIVSVLQLVTHSSQRSTENSFHRCIMALYLLFALKKTSFFSAAVSEKKAGASGEKLGTETENGKKGADASPALLQQKSQVEEAEELELNVKLGSLLFRFLQFLQFNPHEISGWDSEKSKSVFLGGGLFPTLALFNHSCNPSIVRYMVNDTIIVRALRTIRRGEQVTENYGQSYTDAGRKQRQAALLKIFWFNCQCIACREDWPTLNELSKDCLTFRCSYCHTFLCKMNEESMGILLRCGKCSRTTNVLKSLKTLKDSDPKYQQAMDFIKKGQIQTALGVLHEIVCLYDSILQAPFKDYHFCQDALRFCYLSQGTRVLKNNVLQPSVPI